MPLSRDMEERIYESLTDAHTQVKFFQDQVVLTDDEKSVWDNAIYKVDSQIFGDIKIVNKAIDDVKDLYSTRLSGVNSCRSDLFWMATAYNDTEDEYTLTCTKLNENGYTDIVRSTSGNLCGIGSTYFHYLDPADAGIKTAPINSVAAVEQGRSVDDLLFGFQPKNYFGMKYYSEQYALDIGDTFITSFIGTISIGSNQLTVMSPVGSTGEDGPSPVYEVGQIVTCEKDGVLSAITKIAGISLGTADLSQIPTTGIGTTTVSTVNIITLTPSVGLGVSAFDSVSFRILDNPDTGRVWNIGTVTSNGSVYKPNQKYHAIGSTSNFGGQGATFSVYTSPSGAIAATGIATTTGGVQVNVIGNGGLGYAVGDNITIGGTSILLSNDQPGTSADNITFEVVSIDEGIGKYALNRSENMDLWVDPFVPQTVGIMQTSNLGVGTKIEIDNSGNPKGAQGWDPNLNGYEIPMDPNNTAILTKVIPPNVGADKSYWKVGFQTAPLISGSTLAYEGQALGSVEDDSLSTHLTTLSACSAAIGSSLSNALGIVTSTEASFNDADGKHQSWVGATNALRAERNDLCLRIWGQRQSIGQMVNRIIRLNDLKGYIEEDDVKPVLDDE